METEQRAFEIDIISLKKIMVEKKLDKIATLSIKSRVNRNTLSKVLKGEIRPSSDVMDRLASALEMQPEVAGKIFFNINLRNAKDLYEKDKK